MNVTIDQTSNHSLDQQRPLECQHSRLGFGLMERSSRQKRSIVFIYPTLRRSLSRSNRSLALTLGQSQTITPTLSATKVMDTALGETALIEQELTMKARYTIALDMEPVRDEQ